VFNTAASYEEFQSLLESGHFKQEEVKILPQRGRLWVKPRGHGILRLCKIAMQSKNEYCAKF